MPIIDNRNGSVETNQVYEVIPITTIANTWVTVPMSQITFIGTVQVYDIFNKDLVDVEIRINSPSSLEIKSRKAKTYNVRIIGI